MIKHRLRNMNLDPTKLKGWEIVELAEQQMKPISRVAAELGCVNK